MNLIDRKYRCEICCHNCTALFHRKITGEKKFKYDSVNRFEVQRNGLLYFMVGSCFPGYLCRAKWSRIKGQSVNLSPTWRFEQLDRPVTLTRERGKELSSESRLPISNNCTFSDRAAFAFVSARQAGPPRRAGKRGAK